jgi:Protein of unknown function (DUF2012).
MFFGTGLESGSWTQPTGRGRENDTGTLEKMIVANGSITIDLNLGGLGNRRSPKNTNPLRFDAELDSFFTVLVFNNELRGAEPSSMNLLPQASVTLPGQLNASYQQLMLENLPWGSDHELVIRDAKTGFVFFYVEGQEYGFEAASHVLSIRSGRLVLSKQYAADLGRPASAGSVVGTISMTANMRTIEVTKYVDGDVRSDQIPASFTGAVPGPDVIVGDLSGLAQFGSSSGTQVGLAVGTDSCNLGTIDLDWFASPSNDHPVIPQNLYRMSGGATNDERFEQIGQSNVKHAFTALTNNICNLGCNGVGGTHLGSGCSDPYSASLNSGQNLGSRAWINPFTGSYPRGDSATDPNDHSGHVHTGPSHRILTEMADLDTSQNSGATYYAEGQYITPHEYVWCQANPGQCNMNNNVSFRKYLVVGMTSPFSFSPVGSTVRQKAAINAWTGATLATIQPDAANDGIGLIGYKVTNPSPGVWHYEYAIYNQNMDRGIQSFSVPIGADANISNVGFHAPPQQPGWAFDGTVGNAGYSSVPWVSTIAGSVTWNSETFAQNQNANAIRWGTLYNFRFDSDRPPAMVSAMIGFFKTGVPNMVSVMGPGTASASVSVSGRVATSSGVGVSNATVTLSNGGNINMKFITGSFGYFSFDNVPTGNYTVSVRSNRYAFTPQNIQISGNVTGLNFIAPAQ